MLPLASAGGDWIVEHLLHYEVFHGDYRQLFSAPQVYEAVTSEEIRAAAAEVFRRANRTVGIVQPVEAEAAEGCPA